MAPDLNLGLHSLRAIGCTKAVSENINDRSLKRHGICKRDKSKDDYTADLIDKRLEITNILKQKRNVRFSWYCIFRSGLDVATKIKPKCLSNVGHTKIGNYLILSSYLAGL